MSCRIAKLECEVQHLQRHAWRLRDSVASLVSIEQELKVVVLPASETSSQ